MVKMKVREIKKKIKITEINKNPEQEEEMDDSLTDDEIRLILAHKAKMRALQSGGSGEVEIGLKQDVSELERVAQEAPVKEAKLERVGEQAREVKYSAPSGGGAGYDTKRHYDDSNKYADVDASNAEDRISKDAREERRRRGDQNPFANDNNAADSYNSHKSSDSHDSGEKKKRNFW